MNHVIPIFLLTFDLIFNKFVFVKKSYLGILLIMTFYFSVYVISVFKFDYTPY